MARPDRRFEEVKQLHDYYHVRIHGIGSIFHYPAQYFTVIVECCSQTLCQRVRGVLCPRKPEIVNLHALKNIASLYEARQMIPVLMSNHQQMNMSTGRRSNV